MHAPHLIDTELASALRALADRNEVSAARARTALGQFARLRLRRYPAAPLLPRIWALRGSLSAYDATYVALAEALGATLVTADRRLARSGGHRAAIAAYRA